MLFYQNQVNFLLVTPCGEHSPHSNALQYYVKREKCKADYVIFPSGCEARARTFLLVVIMKYLRKCFRHPLSDLPVTRKVESRHTNFHFSSKKITSKSRKVEVFDLTIVKKLFTFRPQVCLEK